MSDAYVGEIRMVAFGYAPPGWLLCQGQTLQIAGNEALYTLLGTTYGGDGQTTFALPNLQSRVPVHAGTLAGGSSYPLGMMGGVEKVGLTANQLPSHSHTLAVSGTAATTNVPATNTVLATEGEGAANVSTWAPAGGTQQPLSAASTTPAGTGGAHENRQPLLALNFIIATEGLFPQQN